MLLSHNSLLTNSRPHYAWPLGVEDIEQQTEGSDDIVKFPSLSPPNLTMNLLSWVAITCELTCTLAMLGRSVWELQNKSRGKQWHFKLSTSTTPHNPNHKPPAFCVLRSHNSLSTNSRPRYARPLGVEDKVQQTEGSDDIVKCPSLGPPNLTMNLFS